MAFKNEDEFQAAKQSILEKVVPAVLHPDMFTRPRLTHEEIAILWAKDHTDVKSKMAICKFEAKTLEKLRKYFQKIGVRSTDDVFDLGRMREDARPSMTREF